VHEWSWQAQEAALAEAYRRVLATSAAPDHRPFPQIKVDWH
jgi:hypothetical protein